MSLDDEIDLSKINFMNPSSSLVSISSNMSQGSMQGGFNQEVLDDEDDDFGDDFDNIQDTDDGYTTSVVTRETIQNLSNQLQHVANHVKKNVIQKVNHLSVKGDDGKCEGTEYNEGDWNENALLDSVIACDDDDDEGFF